MVISKQKLSVISLAILMVGLHTLTGCKDTGQGKASPEAEELTRVRSILEETQKERDSLKAKLTEISESLKAAQSKIDGLLQSGSQAMDVKEQLAKLTEQRDTAITKAAGAQGMVEKLKSQLAEQIKKITGLEGQNKKLQEMLDELKKNLGSEVELPSILGLQP